MNNKILGIALLGSSFLGAWIWLNYQTAMHAPVTSHTVYVEIEQGNSLNQITAKLAEQLPINPLWFKVIAYTTESAKKLKTGEYELLPGLTIPDILAQFVQGKTKQYAITFPEGWSFKNVLQEIENNPHLDHTITEIGQADLLSHFNTELKHPEGLFFPDTYFFEKHTSDVALLKRAYDKMQQVLAQEWLHKADNLPFQTPYQALIMASIVEKETAVGAERPLIAGVFVRRLEKNMLLQTDPTVIYGMGKEYQGDIGFKDLKTETPYNTYVIKGLPPTPIAMPGLDAIHAALHPVNSDSLYFVARGDGTHIFSSTLADHNRAVDIFQRKKHD
jgi:UPF0755 protein